MRQAPVKASKFLKQAPEIQELLLANGAVPVNDIYYDLWDDDSKILILYGGYGSGKSVFFVDKLINECLNNEYFRCFYGRKIYDTVRISVFQTLADRIEERGLSQEFIYSKADNSSMIIKAKRSGGTFNPFGSDNAAKLQSVKDPSHIHCEEMDQFTQKDFGILMSRLRTTKVKTKFMGAFNTTHVKETHWLKKTLFSDQADSDFSTYTINKVFCNYTDNFFINKEEYEQTLWLSSGFNEQKYNEIAAGEWGVEEVGHPFIFNLDRKRHIIPGLGVIPFLPIRLSFDFNVDPITCMAGQVSEMKDEVRILDEFRLLNSDIEELCLRIASFYPDKMLIVTGDASGQSKTALKRELTYYKEIKRILKLEMGQFKLPGANPGIKNTRVLCNALLKKHPNYKFSDRVPYLIQDIEQTETDEHGKIDESKDKHKGHLFAAWRYFNWNFLKDFLPSNAYEKGE
jgi:phage terminase large subunit